MIECIFCTFLGGAVGYLAAAFLFASHDRWDVMNTVEYQMGYEDGFREGRIRRKLSEEQEQNT